MITTEGDGSAVMPPPNGAYRSYTGEQQVSSSTSSFTTTPNVDQPVSGGLTAANASWTTDNSQSASAVQSRNALSARPGASIHRQMIAKSSAAYGLCGGAASNSHVASPYGYAQPGMNQACPPAPFQPVAAPMAYAPVAAPAPVPPVSTNVYQQTAFAPNSGFNSYAATGSLDAPFVPTQPAIQPGFISGSSTSQTSFLAQPPPNYATGSSSSLNASANLEGDKSQQDAANGSRSDRPRRKSGGWNDPPLLSGATSLSNSSPSIKSRTLFQKSPVATASGPTTPTPNWSPYAAQPLAAPVSFNVGPPAATPYAAAPPQNTYPYTPTNTYSYATPPVANFNTNGQYHASPTH